MDKIFDWDEQKNQKLIKDRCISFEAVVLNIAEGNIVGITHGKGKFSHQKQFLIAINGYIYVVPFVEDESHIFLKTIIPSRKMTKKFLKGGDLHET